MEKDIKVVEEDFVYNKKTCKYDLAKVKEFRKVANFNEADATLYELPELEIIGGSADFSYSKIKNLPELATIGGQANFTATPIQNLPKLTTICGNACFEGTLIKELPNLEVVKGFIYIDKTNLIAMPKLKICKGICLCDHAEKDVYYATVDYEFSHLAWVDKKCTLEEYNELVKQQNKTN